MNTEQMCIYERESEKTIWSVDSKGQNLFELRDRQRQPRASWNRKCVKWRGHAQDRCTRARLTFTVLERTGVIVGGNGGLALAIAVRRNGFGSSVDSGRHAVAMYREEMAMCCRLSTTGHARWRVD